MAKIGGVVRLIRLVISKAQGLSFQAKQSQKLSAKCYKKKEKPKHDILHEQPPKGGRSNVLESLRLPLSGARRFSRLVVVTGKVLVTLKREMLMNKT